MTADTSNKQRPAYSGVPFSTRLHDVRALSRQMAGHLAESTAPRGVRPGDAFHRDVATATRLCLDLVAGLVDGVDIADKTRELEDTAVQWARAGVPIETIHHAIHAGCRLGLDLVLIKRDRHPGSGDDSFGAARLVVDLLDIMTTAVAEAYVRELRSGVGQRDAAVRDITAALLDGRLTSAIARECGIDAAERYHVLALFVAPHPHEANPMLDGAVIARRKLGRIESAIAAGQIGEASLARLSVGGGTLLVPAGPDGETDELAAVVVTLAHAAQALVTAALVTADTADIPAAADLAHELLDVVRRSHRQPGLYRFDDLATEYQLTRPGPGREYLCSLLTPLDGHPELLETLQRHIGNNLDRRRTAGALHIHTNTLDYRLKRVAAITGLDPTNPAGLWYLRAALVARSHHPRPTSGAAADRPRPALPKRALTPPNTTGPRPLPVHD